MNNDREFERRVAELWGEPSYVFDAMLSAVHKDEVIELMVKVHAYDSVETKAAAWDKFQEACGEYIIDLADGDEILW